MESRGIVALCALLTAVAFSAAPARAAGAHWAAAWAAAPQPPRTPAASPPLPAEVDNQTLRQTVRLTLAGDRVQVRFSNEFGTAPVKVGAAAVSYGGAVRPLTFAGKASAVIAPGAPLLSDPVALKVAAMGDLTVSLYLPERTRLDTLHALGLHPTQVSTPGNHTHTTAFPVAASANARALLTGVAVWSGATTRVVAALGASVVDGTASTPGAFATWPDVLARRLAARRGPPTAVVNLGIAGNMVTGDRVGPSALSRLDRDVLSQPGLTHIILVEGFNDLNGLVPPPGSDPAATAVGADADALIAGYRQIIARAHQRGIKVIGSPLPPSTIAGWVPREEAERLKVNTFVRESGLFDAVIDFDALMRNPVGLGLRPEYDSGDHLHPNDAGYRVMGDAIDLGLFDAP